MRFFNWCPTWIASVSYLVCHWATSVFAFERDLWSSFLASCSSSYCSRIKSLSCRAAFSKVFELFSNYGFSALFLKKSFGDFLFKIVFLFKNDPLFVILFLKTLAWTAWASAPLAFVSSSKLRFSSSISWPWEFLVLESCEISWSLSSILRINSWLSAWSLF